MYNFNPILNAHLNELVTSDKYVAEKPDYLVVTDGEILINEKKVGHATDVKIGDEVKISVVSSYEHSTAIHALLTSSYGKYVFTVVTISSVKTKDIDGYFLNSYTSKQDRLVCYGFNKKFIKSINLSSSALDEEDCNNTVLIPYYHGNHILKLNTEQKRIVKRILVGKKPHSIVQIGNKSYITLSAENKVAVLENNEVVEFISVGSRPLGIACSNDKSTLYVANYLSGTVSCISLVDNKREDIKVSPGPYCVVVDKSDNIWISSYLGKSITRIKNRKAEYLLVGESSLGLCLGKDFTLWVILPNSNTIGKISTNVDKPFLVRLHLSGSPSLMVDGPNADTKYVLCTGDNTLKEINGVGDIESTIQIDPYPQNVYRFQDYVCVYNSEENDNSFLYLPAPFSGIQDVQQELPRNTYVTTNELVVDTPKRLPASVTSVFSAELIKNGKNVGHSSTVIQGDKIALRFKTPIGEDSMELKLFIGNFFTTFNYVFSMENILPEKFTVEPTLITNPGETAYATLTVRLPKGKSIPFIVSSGNLRVNCMRTDANIAYVKDGDIVVIETESPKNYATTLYVEISAGTYFTLWQITTVRDMFIEYIKPELGHKQLYDIPFTPDPSNIVSKVLPESNYRIVERPLLKEDGEFNESVYALSPLEDKIYELSIESSATQEFVFPPKSRPIDYAKDTENSKLYVALQGAKRIVVLKGSLKSNYSTYDAIIELEKIPIALALFKSDLYVLTDDGYLLIYKQNTGVYETIQVCSKPGAMAIDEMGHVWVHDLATESIREVSLSNTIKSVSAIPGKISDVWALKCYKGILWAVSAYDNSLFKISIRKKVIEQRISLYATPSCIAINPKNGKVWVGHYGSNLVVKLSSVTGEIENRILVDNPVLGLQVDSSDNLWIIQPYKNIKKDQNRTANLTQINPIKLFTFDKVTTDTLIMSNEVEIQGLIRPTVACVTPYMNTQIIVNNIRKGNYTEVRSGDIISLETKSPKEPNTEVVIYLTIGDVVVPFKFSTLDNG